MMQRLTVRLGDIKPNPFRQQIQGGHLDKAKLARVAESIKDTSFWENVAIRRSAAGEIELVYGHVRLAAAKSVLGADYEVELPLMDLTDSMMIKMMALENARSDGKSVAAEADLMMVVASFSLPIQRSAFPRRGRGNRRAGGAMSMGHRRASPSSWGPRTIRTSVYESAFFIRKHFSPWCSGRSAPRSVRTGRSCP